MPITPSLKGGTSVDCGDLLIQKKRSIMLAVQNSKAVKGGQTQFTKGQMTGYDSGLFSKGIDYYLARRNTTIINNIINPNNCWTGYTGQTFNFSAKNAYYGNGKWIAIGQNSPPGNSLIISTDDASTWNVINSIRSVFVPVSLSYGNGVWIVVGSTGNTNMYISRDNAVSWTEVQVGSGSFTPKDVAYGNGKWVAVGTGTQTMYVSTDNALTWNASAGPFPGGAETPVRLASDGNNTWVAVGISTSNSVYISTDNAVTWNGSAGPIFTETGTGVAYGGGRWVITGKTSSGASVHVAGNNLFFLALPGLFSTTSSGGNNGGIGVAYGDGKWVIIGKGGGNRMYTSSDAINWVTSNISFDVNGSVSYGNGTWVLTTDGTSKIYSSRIPAVC
jgi:hypothetical protein